MVLGPMIRSDVTLNVTPTGTRSFRPRSIQGDVAQSTSRRPLGDGSGLWGGPKPSPASSVTAPPRSGSGPVVARSPLLLEGLPGGHHPHLPGQRRQGTSQSGTRLRLPGLPPSRSLALRAHHRLFAQLGTVSNHGTQAGVEPALTAAEPVTHVGFAGPVHRVHTVAPDGMRPPSGRAPASGGKTSRRAR